MLEPKVPLRHIFVIRVDVRERPKVGCPGGSVRSRFFSTQLDSFLEIEPEREVIKETAAVYRCSRSFNQTTVFELAYWKVFEGLEEPLGKQPSNEEARTPLLLMSLEGRTLRSFKGCEKQSNSAVQAVESDHF